MAKFAFNRKSDAEKLLRIARSGQQIELDISDGGDYQSEGFILKTPASGIPKRSGTTCGQAECVPYFLDDSDGELIEYLDDDGNSVEWTVYNIFEQGDITGDTFITAKLVYGVLVADAEDCPAS